MKVFAFLLAGLVFVAPIVCKEYHCTKDKKCESGCCRLEPDGYALSELRVCDFVAKFSVERETADLVRLSYLELTNVFAD